MTRLWATPHIDCAMVHIMKRYSRRQILLCQPRRMPKETYDT